MRSAEPVYEAKKGEQSSEETSAHRRKQAITRWKGQTCPDGQAQAKTCFAPSRETIEGEVEQRRPKTACGSDEEGREETFSQEGEENSDPQTRAASKGWVKARDWAVEIEAARSCCGKHRRRQRASSQEGGGTGIHKSAGYMPHKDNDETPF